MPTKSITLDDDQYLYVLETVGEDDSFSSRVREIVDAGIEAEDSQATHTCRHCGQEFGNPGAKSTHEKSCPEA